MERAIECFENAIERVPGYAPAYAGLACCVAVLGTFTFWTPLDAFPRAKASAELAIIIDSSLPEAHLALGIVSALFDWNRAIAGREFKLAIAFNSKRALAHQRYGSSLCFTSDFENGLAELHRAQRLEPVSPTVNVQLGVGLYLSRRYDEAAVVLQNVIAFEPAFWPAHFYAGLVLAEQHDDSRTIAQIGRSVHLSVSAPVRASAWPRPESARGWRQQAQRILTELTSRSQTEYIAPCHFAGIEDGVSQIDTVHSATLVLSRDKNLM